MNPAERPAMPHDEIHSGGEQRFRAMADNSPLMIWMSDARGHATFMSRALSQWTGIAAATAYGFDWVEMLHPDDRARIHEEFLRANAQRSALRLEYRIRRADGEYRWAIDSAAPYFDAEGEFQGHIGSLMDITERKLDEQSLQRNNVRLAREIAERTAERDRLWQVSGDLMVITDLYGVLKAANPAWARILGYSPDAVLQTADFGLLHPDDVAPAKAAQQELRAGKTVTHLELRLRHADGTYRWIAWTSVPADDLVYAVGRDVTELKESERVLEATEEQLRQSQKMEAIGHLTGGVAHDFNNLLTVVIGNLDSLQRHLPGGNVERMRRAVDHAMQAARRAASLTQRLLAFARRQPLAPKAIDPNQLVTSMSELLTRTLGERVEVHTVLADDLWRVEADPNQLESALLNLAVNARDAMPDGGTLTIETANARLDEQYARGHAEVEPGQYVALCVSDTGAGMSPEVLMRVFEPFYTTKPSGHGTGLGLSQVYGFVKQSGGHVKVYSEPGEGTTVKLYLPRLYGEAIEEGGEHTQLAPPGDFSETVLVVEDEDAVRAYARDILTELGYRVLEASDGPDALRLIDSGERVDLLFTDVGLPSINGRELATLARERRPDLKVLYTTGYARNAIVRHGRLDPGVQMVGKPFTFSELASRVRQVLDQRQ